LELKVPLGADDVMSQHSAAGALCANAEDLVRWSHHLMAGDVFADSLVRALTTPPVVRSGNTTYGFGVGITKPSGVLRISHTGAINGFASVLAYYPEHDVGVAVLFNAENAPPNRLASLLAGTVLGVEIPSVADLATPAEVRARYLGLYDLGPLQLTIFERNGRVWAQGTGQPPNRLLYQGDNEFRLAPDPSVRFVFQLEAGRATGFVLHQGGATLSANA
jgi:D-alanyl-D-alanine carboxypeptidase